MISMHSGVVPVTGFVRTGDRLAWLDYAKAIGICLVVAGHVNRSVERTPGLQWGPLNHWADSLIYSFHMPLFFVLAGIAVGLKNQRGWMAEVKSLFWGVLVPYIVWSIVWVALKNAVPGSVNDPVPLKNLLTIFWQPIDHMWFLAHLLVARLLWFAAERVVSQRNLFVVAIAFVVAGASEFLQWPQFSSEIQEPGDLVINFAYFGAGILLVPVLRTRAFASTSALVAVCAACLWFIAAVVNPSTHSIKAPWTAVLGIVMVIAAAQAMPAASHPYWQAFAFAGQASLAIYVMHNIFAAAARSVLGFSGLLAGFIVGMIAPIVVFRIVLSAGSAFGFPISAWLGLGGTTASRLPSNQAAAAAA
jgi:fucose 4-O-acetylase-like acetyltransferase